MVSISKQKSKLAWQVAFVEIQNWSKHHIWMNIPNNIVSKQDVAQKSATHSNIHFLTKTACIIIMIQTWFHSKQPTRTCMVSYSLQKVNIPTMHKHLTNMHEHHLFQIWHHASTQIFNYILMHFSFLTQPYQVINNTQNMTHNHLSF